MQYHYEYLQHQQRYWQDGRVQGAQSAVPVHFRRRTPWNTHPGHDTLHGRA